VSGGGERRLPLLVDVATLAAERDAPDLVVLDATVDLRRTEAGVDPAPERDGYRAAHVPGAGFADLVGPLSAADAPHPLTLPSAERFAAAMGALGIGDGVHVGVYAQDAPTWATRLWWLLRYFGFDAVSVLDGGLPAWRAAGLPLAAGEEQLTPRTFTARERPELLAVRADVEAVVAGAPARLVNALPAAAFRGERPFADRRPGRIPGSVSLPAVELVDPESRRLVPIDVLTARLDAVGLLEGPPAIAYCGGGIAASLDVFALALAGRDDARLYDASLAEWATTPGLPLVVG